MADKPSKFKFNFNPKIESQVPGEQALRETTNHIANGNGTLTQENTIEYAETYVPVVKVTRDETSFTKGGSKLQKVTVNEDVSVNFQHLFGKRCLPGKTVTVEETSEAPDPRQRANPAYSLINDDVISGPHPLRFGGNDGAETANRQDTTESLPKEPKKCRTKIPVTRLRQTVQKVKDARVEGAQKTTVSEDPGDQKTIDQTPSVQRRSSIPKLKKQDKKTATKAKTDPKPEPEEPSSKELDIPKAEEEFEKIFDEIIEDKSIEYMDNIILPEAKIDPAIETNFEDIIHAYDEGQIEPLPVGNKADDRKSKLPLIKQKSLDEAKASKSYKRVNSLKENVKVSSIDLNDKIPSKQPVYGKDIKEIIKEKELREKRQAESPITTDPNEENSAKTPEILREKVPIFINDEEHGVENDNHKSEVIKQEMKQSDWFKPIDMNEHPPIKKPERKSLGKNIKHANNTPTIDPAKLENQVVSIGYDDSKENKQGREQHVIATTPSDKMIQKHDSKTNNFKPLPDIIANSEEQKTALAEESTKIPQEKNEETEEEIIPILRGNVNRLINQISQVEKEAQKEQDGKKIVEDELPKPKSVLSKIAMFETIEPQTNPRPRMHHIPKTPDQFPRIETVKYEVIDANVDGKPRIIEEVLKTPRLRRKTHDHKTDFRRNGPEIVNPEQDSSETTNINENSEIHKEISNFIPVNINKEKVPFNEKSIFDNKITFEEERKATNEHQPETDKPRDNYNKTPAEEFDTKYEEYKASNRLTEDNGNKPRENLVEKRLRRLKSTNLDNGKLERSKSILEIEIEKSVKGKVSHIIQNLRSETVEPVKKDRISLKELPRKKSVSEKIAIFERKMTPVAMKEDRGDAETEPALERSIKTTGGDGNTVLDDDKLKRKIAELNGAKAKYGSVTLMPVIQLRDGREMPALAIGTALLDPALIKPLIGAAIDLGYRAFDTAYIYGNEKLVGEAIRAKIEDGTVKREDLFIMSKLWSTFHRPDLVQADCLSSLDAMGLTYFDLYMIHNPMSFKEGSDPVPTIAGVVQYSTYEFVDAWPPLETARMNGIARSLGVANFNSEQLGRLMKKAAYKPVVNQVECHPYLNQERLSEFCDGIGVRLSCYGALGSKGTPAAFKSPGAGSALDERAVRDIATELNCSAAQVLISYQLQRGHGVVVKTTSADHLWDNLQALKVTLAPEHLEALNGLNKNRRNFVFKGMGDTHKNYPFNIPF